MPLIKYIGNTQTFDNGIGEPQTFEHDKEYDIQIKYQGQNIVMNGQPVEDPNGFYGIIYNGTQIPYEKHRVEKHWSVKLK